MSLVPSLLAPTSASASALASCGAPALRRCIVWCSPSLVRFARSPSFERGSAELGIRDLVRTGGGAGSMVLTIKLIPLNE
uniref:Uncharacterized protein n=1 Tax=Physcomitrium patens TaxID=3218 RepID=A0A2K1JXP6_PHYPA|nr:hypothetical protein PHYPA_013417 [Physcomitrium patens]